MFSYSDNYKTDKFPCLLEYISHKVFVLSASTRAISNT